MIVHQIQVGSMQNFTYVVSDEDTSECIIIDPSWDLEKIEEIITRNALTVKYIVNTHHHFDHTIGNQAMVNLTNAKIIQHIESTLEHDIAIHNGDKIQFGHSELLILHTPYLNLMYYHKTSFSASGGIPIFSANRSPVRSILLGIPCFIL